MDHSYQEVADMDQTRALEIVKDYIDFLKTQHFDIQQVYLFGSYAKGTFTEDSDIDVAVIMKHLENSFRMQVTLMKLRRKFDTRIEPHPFDEQDFDATNPFTAEILHSGIQVA